MGLGDKFKDLRKQTQDAVAERKENIQHAVEAVGAAANERTQGKYADRIAKVGDRLNSTVEKLSSDGSGDKDSAGAAQAGDETQAASAPESAGADAPSTEPSSAPPDFA